MLKNWEGEGGHHTKFSRQGDHALETCAPLAKITHSVVPTYQTRRCQPKHRNSNIHCHINLKTYTDQRSWSPFINFGFQADSIQGLLTLEGFHK